MLYLSIDDYFHACRRRRKLPSRWLSFARWGEILSSVMECVTWYFILFYFISTKLLLAAMPTMIPRQRRPPPRLSALATTMKFHFSMKNHIDDTISKNLQEALQTFWLWLLNSVSRRIKKLLTIWWCSTNISPGLRNFHVVLSESVDGLLRWVGADLI